MVINQLSSNVHEFRHEYSRSNSWEFWYLLASDLHLDHVKCRRDVVKKDFQLAKDRKGAILLFGDTNCIMQGRNDRRGNKSSVRPENQVDNYFDSVVDTTAEFLSEYPVRLITEGNHETSVNKIHETDIVNRIVEKINYKYKPEIPAHKGGYSGYVIFRFHSAGGHYKNVKLFYHHGYGSGGEVTGGAIQAQRRALFVSDADLVVSGHVHESTTRKFEKIRLTKADKIESFTQRHIILSTYKDEYEQGQGGFHIETGKAPRPIGGTWLRFYYDNGSIKYNVID